MGLRKLFTALGLVAALASSQVHAITFDLGGYTGPIQIKFTNWEAFSGPLAPGVENFGIIRITSIEDNIGNPLWAPNATNGEILGVFRDIMVSAVTPLSGTEVNIKSTGGLMDLFLNPFGSFAAAGGAAQVFGGYIAAGCLPGDACYNGISNVAGGVNMLQLAWGSGIDSGDGTVTVDGNFDVGTNPDSGDAAGYLNVIGGVYATNFDTNGQPTAFGARDLFAQNNFCSRTGTDTVNCSPLQLGWPLSSNDPVSGNFVPEPDTLALLGIALLGLVGLRRKQSV